MKKYATMVVLAASLVGFATPKADAAEFTDVPSLHWAAKEISFLSDKGIIKGSSNDTFNKDSKVTRAQAAAILVRAKKLPLADVPDPGFSDVPVSHLFYKEIAAAVNAGWFSKGTAFRPNGELKRIEMAKITKIAFGIKGSVPVQWEDMGAYYFGNAYVTPLLASGIASGYTSTTFHPSADVTRSQFAVFTARAMNTAFRLPVVAYPKRAAKGLYYPQFSDPAGQRNFSMMNSAFQKRGEDFAANQKEMLQQAKIDSKMGKHYKYEVNYDISRADMRFISVRFASYEYTGGAHGYEQLFADNYDVAKSSFIMLDDLALKSNYERQVVDYINNAIIRDHLLSEKLNSLRDVQNQFYMTPSEFVVFLNPYHYGPYAAGIREFSMPYSMIR